MYAVFFTAIVDANSELPDNVTQNTRKNNKKGHISEFFGER